MKGLSLLVGKRFFASLRMTKVGFADQPCFEAGGFDSVGGGE